MDFIKSDDLSNIFKHISDRTTKSNNKKKHINDQTNLPNFSSLQDHNIDEVTHSTSNQLHKDLLNTLESKSSFVKDPVKPCPRKTQTQSTYRDHNHNHNQKYKTKFDRQSTDNNYKNSKPFTTKIPKTVNGVIKINKLIDTVNKEYNHHLSLYKCPDDELHPILYYVTSSIIPEFSSYQKETRLRCYKIIRERLAYDLDEQDLYTKNNYKKKFNKTEIQTKLLSQKPIHDKWLIIYLADYFNINIVSIYENLVLQNSEYQNRPTLLLNVENRCPKTYINQGNTLHAASIGQIICQKCDYLMTEFKVISKYKLDELQLIAKAINIDVEYQTENGKTKNRRKDELYGDIKNRLSCW